MTKQQAVELAQRFEELIFTTTNDITGMRRENALTSFADALVAAHPASALPQFAYCEDCGGYVPWFLDQNQIVCVLVKHVIASFDAKKSERAS